VGRSARQFLSLRLTRRWFLKSASGYGQISIIAPRRCRHGSQWYGRDGLEDNAGAVSGLWQTSIALVSLSFGFALRCVHRDEPRNFRRTALDHYPRMQWQANHVHRHLLSSRKAFQLVRALPLVRIDSEST
jgi:hypothetical protein